MTTENPVVPETQQFPETKKFIEWWNHAVKHEGLIDVKAFPWLDPETTTESFCTAFNALMSSTEKVDHPELF